MPRAITRPVASGGRISEDVQFEQTSEALAALRPGYPKFYSMADLGMQSRRRWVPLTEAVESGRVEKMFRHYYDESRDRRYSTYQVADAFTHGVLGRVMASFIALDRIWDTGPENLSVRTDIDGGLDWAGVHDTRLRSLSEESHTSRGGSHMMPCEVSLAHWLVCRSTPTLNHVFDGLSSISRCHPDILWAMVGRSIIGASTLIPTFSGTSPESGYRRGQLVLQSMHVAGLAVRTRSTLPRTPGSGPIPVRERGWRTF